VSQGLIAINLLSLDWELLFDGCKRIERDNKSTLWNIEANHDRQCCINCLNCQQHFIALAWWILILQKSYCTTCRGERVLVVIRFNATFLPLRFYEEKMCTCFLKDAESLTTYGCVLWCSLFIYNLSYSLNTTIAFYFVTECSDVKVFVRLRGCHATTQSYFTWPWPVLDSASYSGCSVVPSVTG